MRISPRYSVRWPKRFPPWVTLAQAGQTDQTGAPIPPRWLRDQGGRITIAAEAPTVAHGRREQRTRWAIAQPAVLAGIGCTGTHQTPWPHITSLPPERADATPLLRYQRGHSQIENGLHD